MPRKPARTPLLQLLRDLGTEERRQEFAELCGLRKPNYLYQLGTCKRNSCRKELALAIVEASEVMAARHGTKVLTYETIVTMCAVPVMGEAAA